MQLSRRFVMVHAALALAAAILPAAPAQAAPDRIAGYGAFAPIAGYAMQPDPRLSYRTVFSVTAPSTDPAKVNLELEKVARYINLLAAGGVRPRPGDVVAIVFGPATSIIANDSAYAAKTKAAVNPNIALIAALRQAGATVAVCRQALAENAIEPGQVGPGVRVDAAGFLTIATLQLSGWAYIPE